MDISNLIYPIISIGGLGLVFGMGLGYASKKFAVEVDPKVPLVRDALPGANCGGCGFAGCDAFAKAVVEGKADVAGCPVGGAKCAAELATIMGIVVEEKERTTAFVKCNGSCSNSKDKYEYYGVIDCRDAAMIPGSGAKGCSYGCLGLGSCVKACPFDAITVQDGVAIVDEEKCTSCGNCVISCPKALIEIIPANKKVRVMCNSKDKGKDVKANCDVGCIGCRMCAKACQFDAIEMKDNLASVKYDNCTQCGACVKKCPTKAIASQIIEVEEEKAI